MLARPLSLAGAVVALALVGTAAQAAWSTAGTGAGAGRATAVQAPASAAAAPTSGSGSNSITVTWTVPSSGPAPSGYRVDRVSPAQTICTVPASVLTCADGGRTAGTTYGYTVTSLLATWTGLTAQSASGTTSATTDPPTVSVTHPLTNGTAFTTEAAWNAGCATATTGDICGSTTPFAGRTIAGVVYMLTRTPLASNCWNGASWVTCTQAPAIAATYSSATGTWSAGLAYSNQVLLANLSNNEVASLTLTVTATDSAGAQGTSTRTFSVKK